MGWGWGVEGRERGEGPKEEVLMRKVLVLLQYTRGSQPMGRDPKLGHLS